MVVGESEIGLSLTQSEDLVLFEWLSRFNGSPGDASIRHPAEQRVLWGIECQLEALLSEPLQADYEQRLLEALAAVDCTSEQFRPGEGAP